jgi:hypothetical protein
MSDAFLTFQKFNDPALAATVAEQLKTAGIPYQLAKDAPAFDITFAGNDFEPTTHLKLSPADFPRAHAALETYYQKQLPAMDSDYYLFSFSDAELLEIIERPDEWGPLDYVLAKKLLAERGHPVTPAGAEEFRQQRMIELAKPESAHPTQIISGYFLAVLFGVFGLMLGYAIAYTKKTLPDGQSAYIYSPSERRHGKAILVISAISFSYWLWRIFQRG